MPNYHPRAHAARLADKPALIMPDCGQTISYGELVANADRAAQLFQRLGLQEGDVIAIFLQNHIRYPELCWAAKNSGIIYVSISSHSSVEEAAYLVGDSGARLLISSLALKEVASSVAAQHPGLAYLMVDGDDGPFQSYEELMARESAVPLPGRRRGPSMLYTSGTTGRPKGVRTALPDEPPETPPRRFGLLASQYELDESSVFIAPGPFYHSGPQRFMLTVHRAGGTVIAFRKFHPEATLQALEDHKVTHGVFVPTMFSRLLRLPTNVRTAHDVGAMRYAIHASAPCPIHIKEAMIDWWGPIIYEMYGGSESIGHTFIASDEWLTHKGSVGRPAPGCRIRIVGTAGDDLPLRVPGRIYFSNGTRFEYHNDPDKTRSIRLGSQDEWATYGDIGYLDEEGYLYLTDRESHMIISGGVNIYPQEAEAILGAHPAVADVAVIGIPNEDFGEEVKAVVQPARAPEDPAALAAELLAYCRSRLNPIKCPRSVDFVDALPRNEIGKLMKHVLKQRYWSNRNSFLI